MALALIAMALPARGEDQCRGAFEAIHPPPEVKARALAGGDQPTYIAADETSGDPNGTMELRGNATIVRGDRYVSAESLRFDRNTRQAQASGAVVFGDSRILVESDRLDYDVNADHGTLENASYALREKRARGRATRIIREDATHSRLEGAVYTTCPPGNRDWALKASKVDLDMDSGTGRARNVVVDVRGVPVFYTPYMSFPLSDKRKSGFLVPSAGSSQSSGFEFRTPYYFNLAPNYDLVLTPRYFDKRGAMLEGEFRYLAGVGEGSVNAAYLPGDNRASSNREAFFWRGDGHFAPGWRHAVDINYVSDDQYFEDFGSDLTETSVTHLRRRAETAYEAEGWMLMARTEAYQTLSGTRPYARLPQLALNSARAGLPLGLAYNVDAELVSFDHPDFVNGRRFDFYPSVSLPVVRPAWRVVPRVGYRYTQYSLTNQLPGLNDNPSRSVPIVSMDSGLSFERDLNLWGQHAFQTLEPRLFYLYIPQRDQSDIPLFDTSVYDFRFDSLFRSDRFTGADRVGDANQLTMALTSRILSPTTGTEMLRASLGQIQYFRDRTVDLAVPPTPPGKDNDRSSAVVGEVYARLSRNVTAATDIEWDPDNGRTLRSVAGLRWNPDEDRYLSLSYRLRRDLPQLAGTNDTLEQVDVGVLWPVLNNWSAIGRAYYSLNGNQTLETLAGLGYETCCWGTRVVYRRFVRDASGNLENAVLVQLELKGLSSVGSKVNQFLNKSIRGYPLD